MITLRQLKYLVALSETGQFGRGAAQFNITRQGFSLQLKELESALGFPILERGHRTFSFTARGREVVARAKEIIVAVTDLENMATRRRGTLVGPLAMGIIPSVAPYLLPLCLPQIQEQFPKLEPKVRETTVDSLMDELSAGQLDVAIISMPIQRSDLDGKSIEMVTLFRERMLAAVAVEQAKHYPGRIPAESVTPDQLLLLEEGHSLREQALSYFDGVNNANIATKSAVNLDTILQMVAAGHGITLVPEIASKATANDPRITLKRFAEPEPEREVAMVWRGTNPRTRDFMALADLIRSGYEAYA